MSPSSTWFFHSMHKEPKVWDTNNWDTYVANISCGGIQAGRVLLKVRKYNWNMFCVYCTALHCWRTITIELAGKRAYNTNSDVPSDLDEG